MGEWGMEMGGGGEREIIYLLLHCHHQNDSCIKMDSDESHFNVLVGSDGQSHKTVSKSQDSVQPNALLLGQTSSPNWI